MSQQALGKDVENLTTNIPSSQMSKAEADKTVVTGIAHKYEGAVKHAIGELTRKPSLKESGEQERNEAIEQIHAGKEALERIKESGEAHATFKHENTMQDSEKTGIPDAQNVIQHERDEHPNNPVNEYMQRNPQGAEPRADPGQENIGQREQHLNKQMNKRENPELDPSIVRSQKPTDSSTAE